MLGIFTSSYKNQGSQVRFGLDLRLYQLLGDNGSVGCFPFHTFIFKKELTITKDNYLFIFSNFSHISSKTSLSLQECCVK
jgi:hypothetical protein